MTLGALLTATPQVHRTTLGMVITLTYVVVYLGSWLLAFVDLRRHSELEFHAAGARKFNWMLALFVLGAFAAVPYLLRVRPKLEMARSL